MSDRLAADKGFQEFSYACYDLITKVRTTKSGAIFQKYFQRTISHDEVEILLTNLGYSSKKDFSTAVKKIFQQKEEINRKFPEIVNNDASKAAIESAAKRVVFSTVKPNPHSTADCWVFWMAALSACAQGCALGDDYENCMYICVSAVSAEATFCFLFAD